MDSSDPAFAFARAMSSLSQPWVFNAQIAAAFQASRVFAAFADGAVARGLLANIQRRPLSGVDEVMRALTRFDQFENLVRGFSGKAVADMIAANNSLAVRAFANFSSETWMASVRPLASQDTYEEPDLDALPAADAGLLEAWGGAVQDLLAWMHTRQAGVSAAAVGLTIVLAWWVPLARGRPDLADVIGPPLWGIVFLLLAMALTKRSDRD